MFCEMSLLCKGFQPNHKICSWPLQVRVLKQLTMGEDLEVATDLESFSHQHEIVAPNLA